MIGRNGRIGIFAVILTSLLVYGTLFATAVPQIPYTYSGTLNIGGSAAPAGVTIITNCTNSGGTNNLSITDTTGTNGVFVIEVVFDDTDTNDSTEGVDQSGTTCEAFLGDESLANITPSVGGVSAGNTLSGSASCSDGITNQNETFIDCDGECTACYSLSVSPSSVSKTVLPNATTTQDIVITNNGKYAVAGLAVSAPTLASGNITINFTAPSGALAAGSTATVTLTINVSNGTVATSSAYTGTINVTATNASSNATVSVSVATAESTVQRRRTRYMEWTVLSSDGAEKICADQPIVVSVNRAKDARAIEKVDVDVYLSGKKVFNLLTDKAGQASFTPTVAGSYVVTGQRTRYKDLSETITVEDCGPKVEEPTTTVKKKPTTTVKKKPTTTVKKKPTTTVKKPKPTTTVSKPKPPPAPPAPAPVKKGSSLTTIIIILVVIAVAVLALKKKGSGGGEAPPEAPAAPAEGGESK